MSRAGSRVLEISKPGDVLYRHRPCLERPPHLVAPCCLGQADGIERVQLAAKLALHVRQPVWPAEAWEDPPRVASARGAPVLAVDGFEGPLDWLLEMARAHKIDLARLSIVALIDAFAVAMQAALGRRDGGPMQLAR